MTTDEGQLPGGCAWRAWRPEGAPRALVLLAHGAGEHSGRYGHVGERLAREGWATYAVDHRGHGRTGTGAHIERMALVRQDLRELHRLAASTAPGAPVVLLGHSMGGLVAADYALEHQDELRALVLTGPLLRLDAPAPLRLVVRALSALAPRAGVLAVDATTVSRDPAVVADYEADPLNHHGKLPARTLAELAAVADGLPARLLSLSLPVLCVHGTQDTLVPIASAELLMQHAGSTDKTLVREEGLFHEVLNEPERDRVLDDLAAWVAARLP